MAQIMDTLDREIGTDPTDEPQRIARYLELKDLKNEMRKRQALKEKLAFELDAEEDVWKSGKVVRALALVLGGGLAVLVGAVWKDLDFEQPWRRSPEPTGSARQDRASAAAHTKKLD
jgi:hypothetical protein